MVTIGALEALKTGTTTIVENFSGVSRHATALAQTGLRCVFAESIRDSENVAGPMSPEGLADSAHPASRRSCETKACSASTTCSPPGIAPGRDALRVFPPLRWRKRHRQSCSKPSAPFPKSTISGTRFTCPRAAPRSNS